MSAQADLLESELAQALDQAYAAYQRHYGRPRAMERLRQMLMRSYAAQKVSDEATGADDHWKRIGELAREKADEVLPPQEAPRKAAE